MHMIMIITHQLMQECITLKRIHMIEQVLSLEFNLLMTQASDGF